MGSPDQSAGEGGFGNSNGGSMSQSDLAAQVRNHKFFLNLILNWFWFWAVFSKKGNSDTGARVLKYPKKRHILDKSFILCRRAYWMATFNKDKRIHVFIFGVYVGFPRGFHLSIFSKKNFFPRNSCRSKLIFSSYLPIRRNFSIAGSTLDCIIWSLVDTH